MKVIAVTGGIGSGKSTVLNEFKRMGAYVIDTDAISHEIIKKGNKAYDEVRAEFGDKILDKDAEIDRKCLAGIVFNDKAKLDILNSIMHGEIYAELQRRIDARKEKVVCVEIPLLFTSHCPVDIDLKVTVSASEDIRIGRVTMRDNCTPEDVKKRISAQMSDEKMCNAADVVIVNNGDVDEVRSQVKDILAGLM